MKLKKFILFLLMLLLMSSIGAARTVEVKISQCGKPIAENLNKVIKTLNANDCLMINLDKPGKYEIDGTIETHCNTIIKGISPSSTQLILKEGFLNGKTKFTDDCFFEMLGTESHKIKVEIKDVAFKLADHNGILWENAEKHIVKIYHSNNLVFDNVISIAQDAAITNLDLRNCSNVLIQNCTFENYNNCKTGGCVWSRGNQENIVIKNNKFWKYGNDEALAIWGGTSTKDMTMKNIRVYDNEFFYENKIRSKKNISIDVLINFAHFEGNGVNKKCYVDSVFFTKNTITNNAQSKRNILLDFDDLAHIGTIEVSNNTINNNSKCQVLDGYMTDITIKTGHTNMGNIIIDDNRIYNEAEILWNGKDSGYTFLGISNGNVQVSNNYMFSDYPVAFMWGHGGKITLNLYNNTASTLCNTAILSDGTKLEKVVINANNNEFTGDTRIYCRNIDELELNFTNNTLNSNNYHFFLQEAAPLTSVNFDRNTINALTGGGTIYANYSGGSYVFKDIKITNNLFNGVSKNDLEQALGNAKRKSITNNIYR